MNKTALILTFWLGIAINDASSLLDADAAAKDPVTLWHSGSGHHTVYMMGDSSASMASSSWGMDYSAASAMGPSDSEDVDMDSGRRSRAPSPDRDSDFRFADLRDSEDVDMEAGSRSRAPSSAWEFDALPDADLIVIAEEVEEELRAARASQARARASLEREEAVEFRPADHHVRHHALGPAPAGNPGIVGVFVPPAAPVDPAVILRKNLRAAAHRDAFPFAPFHWHFLANIQKAWLRRWSAEYGQTERYPLARAIPSFGWTEQMRLEGRDEPCQMCGRDHLTVVVIMHNPRSPLGKRILRVGVDCATFMKLTQDHVYQIAWENEVPLP